MRPDLVKLIREVDDVEEGPEVVPVVVRVCITRQQLKSTTQFARVHVLYPERWIEGVMMVVLWRFIALRGTVLAS